MSAPSSTEHHDILGFGHLLIQVHDIAAAEHFYIDLLGFRVRKAKPLADGRPFTPFHEGIALTAGGPAAGTTPRQIDHIAFEVRDVRQLDERLRQAGVPFDQGLHDGPYGLTIYVRDPDGTRVELYQRGLTMQ